MWKQPAGAICAAKLAKIFQVQNFFGEIFLMPAMMPLDGVPPVADACARGAVTRRMYIH